MVEHWIRLREFARRRGVALSAVQKAIESGRVTAVRRNAKGHLKAIEFVQASAQWDANTDPAEAAKNGKFLGATQPNTPPADSGGPSDDDPASGTMGQGSTQAAAERDGETREPAASGTAGAPGVIPDKDPHGYYAARAERERTNAAQQQLDYSKALGLLVSSAEVKQLSSRRYRAIRDRVLNIPDRVAAILAAERDPAQVHATLTAELKRVLHELSDDARAEATGGVAVGVAA